MEVLREAEGIDLLRNSENERQVTDKEKESDTTRDWKLESNKNFDIATCELLSVLTASLAPKSSV